MSGSADASPPRPPLFTLSGVCKHFPNEARPVLDVGELELPRGRLVTVLGRSGSGKTTFLKLLGLLDPPYPLRRDTRLAFHSLRDGTDYDYAELYPGRARFDPLFRRDAARARLRRTHFGFLFQEEHLLNQLSVRDNIALPMLLRGVPAAERERRVELMLEALQLDVVTQRGAKSVFELSKGERQRVALLRALLHDPEVLFADEPTGNLDPLNAEWIFRMFAFWIGLHPERTVIVVTHSTHLALSHSQSIVVFGKGWNYLTLDNVPSRAREAERQGWLNVLMNADDPAAVGDAHARLQALHAGLAAAEGGP
ncbi:MAG TPA: ATP-binding cassette domain-containing protein [Gammaproteobacteria bacterium]